MAYTVKGRIGEIFLVRLEPEDDLLLAIRQAIQENGIKTGVILDITGGLIKARVQKFARVGPWQEIPVEIVEIPGPMEVSGHGIIGQTRGSGGTAGHHDGQPYIHCHVTLTTAERTVCGHLMEGTYVRSYPGKSHFTVFLASIEGAILNLMVDPTQRGMGASRGWVHHELEQIDDEK